MTLREQVLRQVAARRAPTRDEAVGANRLAASAALAVAAAVLVLAGGPRAGGRPLEVMLATPVLAGLIGWLALGRGGAMVGRPRGLLVALVVAAPLALAAGKLALGAAAPDLSGEWLGRPGFRCLALFLAIAAAPLAATLWIARHRVPPWRRLQGATLGIVAGACAWSLVELWCPMAYPAHIAVGHLLPLALVVGAGALARRA